MNFERFRRKIEIIISEYDLDNISDLWILFDIFNDMIIRPEYDEFRNFIENGLIELRNSRYLDL